MSVARAGMLRRLARFVRQRPGFAGVLGVAMAEAAMNGTFGWQMGKGYAMGPWIMMLFLVANELVKIQTAEMLGEKLVERDRAAAAGAGLLLFAVTFISLSSHIGFIGLSRGDATSKREATRDAGLAVQSQLKTALAERQKIGPVRPPGAIEAELKRVKEGTARHSRLGGEFAAAQEAKRLDALIASLEGRRASAPTVGTADPQAYVLGWFWDVDEEMRKLSIAIAIAIAMEMTTTLGFIVFGSRGRERMDLEELLRAGAVSLPGVEHILPFRTEALEPAAGDSVAVDAVVRAYEAWAGRTGRQALARDTFLRLLEGLGVRRQAERFVGVRLRPVALVQAGG